MVEQRLYRRVLYWDSKLDALLEKIYDSFMPSKPKSVILLQENHKKR